VSESSEAPGLPTVDFYVLERGADEEARRVACRLAEKAWQQGYRVLLRTADADRARTLDDLLWTFRQESFVPHGLHDEDPDAPVVIAHGDPPLDSDGLLINLGSDVPEGAARFQRIAEVVETTAKDAGRLRYRVYREREWPLRTHSV